MTLFENFRCIMNLLQFVRLKVIKFNVDFHRNKIIENIMLMFNSFVLFNRSFLNKTRLIYFDLRR